MPPQNQSLFTALTAPPTVGVTNEDRTRRKLVNALLGRNAPNAGASRRRLAESLIKEGSSGAPVQHFTQGINRALQGFVGGQQLREAERQEQVARQQRFAQASARSNPLLQSRSRATAGHEFGLEGDALNRFALTGKLADADGGTATSATERIAAALQQDDPSLSLSDAVTLARRGASSQTLARERLALSAFRADPSRSLDEYRQQFGAVQPPQPASLAGQETSVDSPSFLNLGAGLGQQLQATPSQAGTRSNPLTPQSQADIDNAPPGTVFSINGQLMVK